MSRIIGKYVCHKETKELGMIKSRELPIKGKFAVTIVDSNYKPIIKSDGKPLLKLISHEKLDTISYFE